MNDLQVDYISASADGVDPDSLTYRQWPVSNVMLRHARPDEGLPREVALVYECRIPSDTPEANRYDADENPIPDPEGMALAWVKFQLLDANGGDVLDENDSDHTNGVVQAFLTGKCELWNRLTPGGPAVNVKLTAAPWFYYLKDGGAQMQYTTNSDGYFHGAAVNSVTHILTMNENGDVLLDGKARVSAQDAGDAPDDGSMAKEAAEAEAANQRTRDEAARENREHDAEVDREEAEAKRQAEAEAKREQAEAAKDAQYDQTSQTDPSDRDLLMEVFDSQFKGNTDADEQFADYLRKTVAAGGEYAEAARALANERGYSL